MHIEKFLYNLNILSDNRTIFILKYIAANGATDYKTLKQEYDYWINKNGLKKMFKSLSRLFLTRLESEGIVEALVYDKYGFGRESEDLLAMLSVVDDFDSITPDFVISENFGYSIKPRMAKVYDIIDDRLKILETTFTVEEAVEKRKEIIFDENEKKMDECKGKIILRYDWRKS